MASTIYYFPDAASPTLKTVSLAYCFTDLQDSDFDERTAVSESWLGDVNRVTTMRRRRVRVVYERTPNAQDARELDALAWHLRNGGAIGVALDASKAWGGFAYRAPRRGDGTVRIQGADGGTWFGTSPSLASGDEIVIQSLEPSAKSEILKVSSLSGNTVTLSNTVRMDYDPAYPVLVRERNFWPALILAPNESGDGLLTSENRITWTFSAPLVEDRRILAALPRNKYLSGGAANGTGVPFLEELRNDSKTYTATGSVRPRSGVRR